ncbi:sporulation protein YunB [Alicyclobacillus tolerans]|uniref:sporulation protein YunB n=1 Tax=Alicyclobacillus tolerans TaxID=90970 RepID=UPI001F01132F|nr:sporulation protein YunB [Alicyclobacillus tolerans]MCF8565211.1 sporulation protein YunB [Alicyclobacillus tolerans]
MVRTRFKSAGARRSGKRSRGRSPFFTGIAVLMTAVAGFLYLLDARVRPAVSAAARAVASRAAVDALNQAITEEISHDVEYDRIVQIDSASHGEIQVARFNFSAVTKLQAAATKRADEVLNGLSEHTLTLPVTQILAGSLAGPSGPRLPVHLLLVGAAHSSVTTQVKSVGVNQTVHILNLNLTAQVNVVTPLISTPISIESTVPVAYVVLAGKVPDTFMSSGSSGTLAITPSSPVK